MTRLVQWGVRRRKYWIECGTQRTLSLGPLFLLFLATSCRCLEFKISIDPAGVCDGLGTILIDLNVGYEWVIPVVVVGGLKKGSAEKNR
jgi:hypothetical protein